MLDEALTRKLREGAASVEAFHAAPQLPTVEHSTFDEVFDDLAAKRWRKAGRSYSGPEPPTLVAPFGKVPGKGEVWLVGLPTRAGAHGYPRNVRLQISVFHKHPTEVGIGPRGREEDGIVLPGALHMSMPISDPHVRTAAFARTC